MKQTRTIRGLVVAAVVATAAALAAPARAAKWRYPIKDLREMVAEADAVVRGRMVRAETGPDERAVAVIDVEKVLRGACPQEVRIPNTGPPGRPDCACEVGGVYYLCLGRSPPHDVLLPADTPRPKDLYDTPNELLTKIPVADGRVERPPYLRIPEEVAFLFPDDAVATWEAGLVWLGGPRLRVRPAREAFDFDEPVRLEVTLTNPAGAAMGLPLPRGRLVAAAFYVRLFDGGGFPVLDEPWSGYDAVWWGEGAYEPPVRTVEPGRSVTVRLAVRLHPALFAQDPASARTLQVSYWSWGGERAWRGSAGGQTPIRLRCPDRAWAAELRTPGAEWAVDLEPARGIDWGGEGRVDLLPGRGLPVRVYFRRRGEPPSPLPLGSGGGGRGSWGVEPDPPMARTLAACCRLRRNGRPPPGPEADARPLRALLAEKAAGADGPPPSWNGYLLPKVDLAEFFDLSAPGDYRVRFVLPGGERPSRSETVHVRVLEPTP